MDAKRTSEKRNTVFLIVNLNNHHKKQLYISQDKGNNKLPMKEFIWMYNCVGSVNYWKLFQQLGFL